MSGASVTVRSITKSFGGVRALRGVELDVVSGEVHGILGPNGSGKSTLMKIIAGLRAPDSGEVRVDDEPLSSAHVRNARRAGVVLMPQELTTVPRFTVAQQITMGVERSRGGFLSRRAERDITERQLARIGLDIAPTAAMHDLSATEQRMVMMAGALAGGARVLILDEPTAGLPARESEEVVEAIKRLRSTGCTVLLVTHRLDQLRAVSDRITVLRDGVVSGQFYEGTPDRDELVASISDPGAQVTGTESAPRSSATSSSAGETLIEFEGVALERLRSFSLAVRRGSMVGVLGLPGSGIDELVQLANGERRASSGRVLIGAERATLTSPADAARHGSTFVSGNRKRMVMGDRSTATHVGLSSMAGRTRFGFVRQKVEDLAARSALDVFGVTADPAQPLATLSGGNQQRALMSRCVASQASVVVAHEPTVGIDVHAREALRDHLVRFAEDNAVLVISADPEELVGLCPRIVCLRDGQVSGVIEGEDARMTSALLKAIA